MPNGEINEHSEMFSPDEWRRIRARVHNINDKLQGHALFLEGHRVDLARINDILKEIRSSLVTTAQLADRDKDIAELRNAAASKAELAAATVILTQRDKDIAELRAIAASKAELAAAGVLYTLRLDAVMKAQEKTDAHLAKAMWIVLTAVISAVLGMVLLHRGDLAKLTSAIGWVLDVAVAAKAVQ